MRTLKKKDVRIKLRLASSSVATVEQKSDIKRCCRAALYCKSTVYMVLLNRILCFATDNRFQITSVQKIHCLEILIKKKTTINLEKHVALLVVLKACILYEEEEVVDGRSYAELCLNYGYKTSYPNSFRTSRQKLLRLPKIIKSQEA